VQPQTLEKWLVACAKAARSYLYPTLLMHRSQGKNLRNGWITYNLGESLLTNLIISEEEQTRQSQQAQINDVLVAALAKLDGNTTNTTCTTKGLTTADSSATADEVYRFSSAD